MNKKRIWGPIAGLLAAGILLMAGGCKNSLTSVLQAIEDRVFGLEAPTVLPTPGHGMTAHETIQVRFQYPMDTSTFTFEGPMSAYGEIDHWESISFPNDTVYLKTEAGFFWSDATEPELIISCQNVPEPGETPKSLTDYSITWDVFRGVCVDPDNFQAVNYGTVLSPKPDIPTGIVEAQSIYGTNAEVRIIGGGSTIYVTATINVIDGISISGSYDPTWSTIDYEAHPTQLRSVTMGGTDFNTPSPFIGCSGVDIQSDTVIEGIVFILGDFNYQAGIYSNLGSPTLRNNKFVDAFSNISYETYGIYGRDTNFTISNCDIFTEQITAFDGIECYGIVLRTGGGTSSATISGNTISGSVAGSSYGIWMRTDGSTTISGNTIDGGQGPLINNAIHCIGSSPVITGNTLYATSGVSAGVSSCIYLIDQFDIPVIPSNPQIESNFFYNKVGLPKANSAIAINEGSDDADPAILTSNFISYNDFDDALTSGCLYYYNEGGVPSISTFAEFNNDNISITTGSDTLANLGNVYQ